MGVRVNGPSWTDDITGNLRVNWIRSIFQGGTSSGNSYRTWRCRSGDLSRTSTRHSVGRTSRPGRFHCTVKDDQPSRRGSGFKDTSLTKPKKGWVVVMEWEITDT